MKEPIGLLCLLIVIALFWSADDSYVDNKRTDCIVASYHRFALLCPTLTLDEHSVADPLHTRRSGFAASKGQSSVVAA